jgi:hypothetical protein
MAKGCRNGCLIYSVRRLDLRQRRCHPRVSAGLVERGDAIQDALLFPDLDMWRWNPLARLCFFSIHSIAGTAFRVCRQHCNFEPSCHASQTFKRTQSQTESVRCSLLSATTRTADLFERLRWDRPEITDPRSGSLPALRHALRWMGRDVLCASLESFVPTRSVDSPIPHLSSRSASAVVRYVRASSI